MALHLSRNAALLKPSMEEIWGAQKQTKGPSLNLRSQVLKICRSLSFTRSKIETPQREVFVGEYKLDSNTKMNAWEELPASHLVLHRFVPTGATWHETHLGRQGIHHWWCETQTVRPGQAHI
ncbi:uncharacterized protein LOC110073269 [Pogona vitticeps]